MFGESMNLLEGQTYSIETWDEKDGELTHTGWNERTIIRLDGDYIDYYYFDVDGGKAQLGRVGRGGWEEKIWRESVEK